MIEIDWSKPKEACQTPGCDWPNWHICLVGKEDLTEEVLSKPAPKKKYISAKPRMKQGSLEFRTHISNIRQDYWARVKERNRERDAAIVARYAEGNVSIKMLVEEFGISRNPIRDILKAAEAEGRIVMRPVGLKINCERKVKELV